MTLQHVVLFGFPDALNNEEVEEFRSIVTRWTKEIGTMANLRLGEDLGIVGDRTQNYQYLLYMEFPDILTFTEYRAHPAHVELSHFVAPRGCRVLAFDYELNTQTTFS